MTMMLILYLNWWSFFLFLDSILMAYRYCLHIEVFDQHLSKPDVQTGFKCSSFSSIAPNGFVAIFNIIYFILKQFEIQIPELQNSALRHTFFVLESMKGHIVTFWNKYGQYCYQNDHMDPRNQMVTEITVYNLNWTQTNQFFTKMFELCKQGSRKFGKQAKTLWNFFLKKVLKLPPKIIFCFLLVKL